MPQEFVERLTKHVTEEEGMFKAIRYFSAIFTALILVLSWIFVERNNDIKAMQGTLQDHSIKIERTLVLLEAVINSDKRQQESIDKTRERVWSGGSDRDKPGR